MIITIQSAVRSGCVCLSHTRKPYIRCIGLQTAELQDKSHYLQFCIRCIKYRASKGREREREQERMRANERCSECSNELDFLHLEIVFELAARFSFVVAIYQFYCPLKFTDRMRANKRDRRKERTQE